MRFLLDCADAASFDDVVALAEARVEKIDDFFALEQKLTTNETLRKAMADYHDLVDRGRREIYRLES